jgi:hypothetical protein
MFSFSCALNNKEIVLLDTLDEILADVNSSIFISFSLNACSLFMLTRSEQNYYN